MTDYFALLQFPRTPWVESEEVNSRFLQLSSAIHPDRVHGGNEQTIREANQQFAQLNAAVSCLRDPKDRLQHLLQLETGAVGASSQSIPPELIDLFGRVGQTCRSIDQFLAERTRVTSPMIQAQHFAQALDWSDRVADLQNAVNSLRQTAETEIKAIAARWPAEKPLPQLQKLAHIFATTNRWDAQLKERFATLASS